MNKPGFFGERILNGSTRLTWTAELPERIIHMHKSIGGHNEF